MSEYGGLGVFIRCFPVSPVTHENTQPSLFRLKQSTLNSLFLDMNTSSLLGSAAIPSGFQNNQSSQRISGCLKFLVLLLWFVMAIR